MLPQAGVGGCTPNPRNEMAASATMNCENCKLATMMMDGATLGRMWRNRGRARRPQTLGHVADEGVVGSEDRRGERREHCRRREDEAEEAEAVPPDRGRLHATTSRLVRGSSHPYRRSTPRLMRV